MRRIPRIKSLPRDFPLVELDPLDVKKLRAIRDDEKLVLNIRVISTHLLEEMKMPGATYPDAIKCATQILKLSQQMLHEFDDVKSSGLYVFIKTRFSPADVEKIVPVEAGLRSLEALLTTTIRELRGLSDEGRTKRRDSPHYDAIERLAILFAHMGIPWSTSKKSHAFTCARIILSQWQYSAGKIQALLREVEKTTSAEG